MAEETLAKGFVELSADTDKLKDSLNEAGKDIAKLGKQAESSFGLGIGKAVFLAKQYNHLLNEGIKNQKRFSISIADSLRKSNETPFGKMKDFFKKHQEAIGEGIG